MTSRIASFTLGGTIAMAGGDRGVVTRLGGQDLVDALTGYLEDQVVLELHDMRAVPSANLSFVDVLEVVDAAVGSERDLRERGLINGGFLHPYKAPVLLRVLLAADADRDRLVAAFGDYV